MTRLRAVLRGFFGRIPAIVGSVLSEIFDESAYARFLERRQLTTSPQAYAEFLRESEATRQRRPRCC
ncbi:MAG: hypothetical protein WA637_13950 [Terriglobales bacterium]